MLTPKRLKTILSYDPLTGDFTYLQRRGACMPGSKSGKICPNGYWAISIDRKMYRAHRLAWFYVNEAWPAEDLDHINCDKLDNRIANLRVATCIQNNANQRKRSTNTSGFKGVTWHRQCRKWQAAIKVSGKNYHLGLFDKPEDAHAAYIESARKHFGAFARAA